MSVDGFGCAFTSQLGVLVSLSYTLHSFGLFDKNAQCLCVLHVHHSSLKESNSGISILNVDLLQIVRMVFGISYKVSDNIYSARGSFGRKGNLGFHHGAAAMANQKKTKAGGRFWCISKKALIECTVVGVCTLILALLPVLIDRISATESVIKVREAVADWCTPSICFLVLIAGAVVATSGVLWGGHHQQEGNMMKRHQERNIITESLLLQRPVANSQIDPLCMPDIFFSLESAKANAIAQAARANAFTNPVRISPPIPTGLPEYYPAYVTPQAVQLVRKSEEDFKDARGFVERGFEDRGFEDRGFVNRVFQDGRFEERRFEDGRFDERRFAEGGRYLQPAVVVDSEDENNSEAEDRFDEHEAGYEPGDERRFVHADKVRFQPDETSVIYDAEDERRYHSEGGDGGSETEDDENNTRFDDFRYAEEGSDSDSEDEGKYDPGFEVHPMPSEISSSSPPATKHFPQAGIVSKAIDSPPPPIVVHPRPPFGRWTPIQVSSRNLQEQDFHPLIGISPNAPSRRQSHGVPTFINVQASPPALPIADISPVNSIHMREMVPYIDHRGHPPRKSLSPDSHTVAATAPSAVPKVPSPSRPSTFETVVMTKPLDTVVAAGSSAVRGSSPKVLSPPKPLNSEAVASTRVETATPVNVVATSSPKILDPPKPPQPEVATPPETVAPVGAPTISTSKMSSPKTHKPEVAPSTTRSEIAVSGPAVTSSMPKVPSPKAEKSKVPKSDSPVLSSRPSSPKRPEAEPVVLMGRESLTQSLATVAPPKEVSHHKSWKSEVVSSDSRQANGERMPSAPASKTGPPILQRQHSIPMRRPREVMVADYDPAEETDRKHDPDDDLDQRIEAYIKNFREQMRLQRQESLLRHRRGAGDT